MTPEIEQLRAAFKAKDDAATEAKRLAAEAMDALNKAVAAWAKEDLAARGIEINVTPVEYGTVYRSRETHWSRYNGPCAVTGVSARNGEPLYHVRALTKTGQLSKAIGAFDRYFDLVRPWVAK